MFTVKDIVTVITIFSLWGNIKANSFDEMHKAAMESPEAKKCMESTGFDLKGPPPEESPEGLCFLKCLLTEDGVINENGDIDPVTIDNITIHFPQDKMEEMKQCMLDLGKIKTCEDMKKYIACKPHP